MKKFYLVIVSIYVFFVTATQAQKIKIKNDQVIIDDVPVLFVSKPKSKNIFKYGDYLYSSLEGDSLVRFRMNILEIPTTVPNKVDKYLYFEAHFIPFRLHVQFSDTVGAGMNIANRKTMTRFLFNEQKIKINQGKLDSASVYAFCKRVDISKKLQAEINFKKGLYEAQRKSLAKTSNRDLRRAVILRLVMTNGTPYQQSYASSNKSFSGKNDVTEYRETDPTKSNTTNQSTLITPLGSEYVYEIIQDDKLIGRIYERVTNGGQEYRIEKRMSPAFEYEGQQFPFILMAYINADGRTVLITYDNKTDILWKSSNQDFKLTIIDYLINHYYL